MRGDTLVGQAGGGLHASDTLRTLAVPLAEVRSAEVRSSNLAGSGAIVLVAMLMGAILFVGGGGVMGD